MHEQNPHANRCDLRRGYRDFSHEVNLDEPAEPACEDTERSPRMLAGSLISGVIDPEVSRQLDQQAAHRVARGSRG